jgi:hypothetical protein
MMIRYSGQGENELVEDLSSEFVHAAPGPLADSERTTFAQSDNLTFFSAALRRLRDQDLGAPAQAYIGLVGQCDLPGVALRRAQAELRWDRRPSLWSHAFVLGTASAGADLARAPVFEVSLHSRSGRFPEPENNAVTEGWLGLYGGQTVDANAALIAVGVDHADLEAIDERAARKFNLDRLRYNLWDTLGVWQAYLWTPGAPNPLREGFPVFSSAFVEYCFEAIELDLSPGASERNSAPEHLWNAARYWPEAFAEAGHQIAGACVLRDLRCGVLDSRELRAADEELRPW